MRYIRTKDGRIVGLSLYKEDCEINGAIRYIYKPNGGFMFIGKDNIHKQAETIEELINRYIVISGSMKVVYNKVRFEKISRRQLINDIRSKKKIVYGAIWTIGEHGEPILKSVSQMNEEGDLKLI